MAIVRLALQSLWNRRLTGLLAILAVTLSVTLFLGVERVRISAKSSFADTISGTDLIVGARSGDVQLLLYSVFRIGNATRNITMQSLDDIGARPEVAWVIPLSLGDSHRGFRVLGTTPDYFEHYRYRSRRPLAFTAGGPFDDLFDAVIGADVAAQLDYRLDDPIVVQHGIGSLPGQDHDDKPFRVAGVLAKTGTPVDRTVHVSLEAIEAIHIDWQGGARKPGPGLTADQVRNLRLRPTAVTAAMIGVTSKIDTFALQRFVNEYRAEPLTAILPGVALQELWSLVGVAETALSVVSAMVLLTALLGMVTMILTTLNERRREMAILRSVGARPRTVFGLLVSEAGLLTLAGVALGTGLLYLLLAALRPAIDARFGLHLAIEAPSGGEAISLVAIVAAGCLAGFLPAWRAYRRSLADGMTIRL